MVFLSNYHLPICLPNTVEATIAVDVERQTVNTSSKVQMCLTGSEMEFKLQPFFLTTGCRFNIN